MEKNLPDCRVAREKPKRGHRSICSIREAPVLLGVDVGRHP